MSQDLAALHQDWRARKQAMTRLAADRDLNRAATAEQLVDLIQAESLDLGVLNGALQTLVVLGRAALERLTPLFTHPLSEVRQAAAVVLGQLQPPLGVPALRGLLSDEDTNVRYHAIESLGQQRARSAVPELAELALGEDFFLAFAAVEALGAIRDARALPELVLLLEQEMLAGAAAGALARIGHPLVLQPLLERLVRQPDAEVIEALRRLLSEHPLTLSPQQLELLRQHQALPDLDEFERACRELDQPALRKFLTQQPDRVLPLLQGEESLAAVLEALLTAGPRLRRLLVDHGVRLGTPLEQLRSWLTNPQAALRGAAARWLCLAGRLGPEELLGWWQLEADEKTRCEVLEICELEAVLAAALRAGGAAEAALAVRCLSRLPAERGLPLLRSLPRPEDLWWSIYLCRTLGRWGVASDWLREMLSDARPPVRAEAALALAQADPELAAGVLPNLLSDTEPDVSEAALAALAGVGEWEVVAEQGDLQLLAGSPRPQDVARVLTEFPDTFEALVESPNAGQLAGLELSQPQWQLLGLPVDFRDSQAWVRREALLRDYAKLRPQALLDVDDRIRQFAERWA